MPRARCGRLKPNRPAGRQQASRQFLSPCSEAWSRQQLSESPRRVDCLGFFSMLPTTNVADCDLSATKPRSILY
jgi:hypothetical protein